MEEEEEEDRALLGSLGVTSANPEDIEHDVLEEARNHAGYGSEAEEFVDVEPRERRKLNESSSTCHTDIYNKLRAIEVEISAVAATIEDVSTFSRTNEHDHDGGTVKVQEDRDEERDNIHVSSIHFTLQRALATDRLESLKKTKALLEKEISNLTKDDSVAGRKHEKVLRSLVKEKPPRKRRQQEVLKSRKDVKNQRHKTVSFEDDTDFDRVLNAASAGFVETEKDELIRKGVLTPFHKLKGYERRFQEVGPPSNSSNLAGESSGNDDLVSTSINRAVRSISEAAQARPTTKLLDPESLPKLDAPTRPFRRLKTPLKATFLYNDDDGKIRKNKRPLPGEKWRKKISREENKLEEAEDTKSSSEEDKKDVKDAEDNEPPFVTLEGGLKIPETIFGKLFDYQKVGVQWLWELHCQRAGGIIGDEMGLGKTIQVLAFLGALHFSGMYKPSIILCPVTLLRQWKREATKWYPSFHVEILHDSAQVVIVKKQAKSSESDYETEESVESDMEERLSSKNAKKWDALINRVLINDSGMLITTYEQLRLLGEKLLDIEWGYAVLDEGHKIRNPNAEITLVCKQLQTVHRVIMTGAPIQNRLTELWSLFDFVFPGKLGVLPVFEAEFAVPISVGGYANASPLQVSTAYRCAVVLRDLIMPYLLRRMKLDVNAQLPKKTEHVLFCSLTSEQGSVYRAFLASSEVEQIFTGARNSLYGIDIMRKICNHPDLLEREHASGDPDFGNPERSGKMKVVTQVLKVGGLGTNLTGADRVIIFDPDWNPSTDMQARERAWRIGQTKDVTVYRLITRGTIEEKVYHRQIYKHFLTNKILKNPQQRRFFKARDMKDLFTLNDDGDGGSTETSNIFSQISEDVNVVTASADAKEKESATRARNSDGGAIEDKSMSKMGTTKRKGKEKPNERNEDGVNEETNILRSLFDAHGIHSAVNHDVIMNVHEGEKLKLEEQASQVAQRAAEALRISRMLRSRDSISVPTWTGKSGAAGAPASVSRKFGSTVNSQLISNLKKNEGSGFVAGASAGKALSSAELLAKIRVDRERAVSDGLEHQHGLASSSSSISGPSRPSYNLGGVQPEILIRQICTFVQQQGGSSNSASIVDHFKERIPSKDLPLFKSLLKEIATLERTPNGSCWILKPEYQEAR